MDLPYSAVSLSPKRMFQRRRAVVVRLQQTNQLTYMTGVVLERMVQSVNRSEEYLLIQLLYLQQTILRTILLEF